LTGIDTREVNNKLDLSLLDLKREDWKSEMVGHELEERRQIAHLLCQPTTGFTDEASLDHRVRII